MRLTKLTLCGFKSFADRTELRFDQPITGIVGPNGCGKSNVVDAIKWVLGERSAKSLRSKEMQDVIFAGSAGRGPSGFASVVLTFDNPLLSDAELSRSDASEPVSDADGDASGAGEGEAGEGAAAAPAAAVNGELADLDERSPLIRDRSRRRRALPIDAETVDVERRLSRDGTSQYLINGARVRLRDIRELFMDTGVGADAYSIIEQGKVDAMLLASPADRRTIFEEAAGIAKFKARRIEAQRKLERTETNLAVVREQLASTERRLKTVRTQAEKARRYKELSTQLLSLRMAQAFERYHELRERLDGLTSRMRALEDDREQAEATLRSVEQLRQDADLAQQEALALERSLESERLRLEHEAQASEQRQAMREQAASDAQARAESETSRLDKLRMALQQQRAEADQAQAALADSESHAKHAEAEAAAALEARAQAEESLASARSEARRLAHAVSDIERELEQRGARQHGLAERLAALVRERDAAQARAEKLACEAQNASQSAADAEARRAALASAVEARAADLVQAEAELKSLSQQQRSQADAHAKLESRQSALISRRDALAELLEAREGLAEGARAALARKAAGDDAFASIVAPLAELIDVDAADARAVETALGEKLGALVVEGDLTAACEAARRQLGQPCLFVSAAGASEARGDDAPAPVEGAGVDAVAPRVATLVRAQDPRVADWLARALADVRLARDLESATLLAAGPLAGKRCRFVTPTGEALEPDGVARVVGLAGEAEAPAGVLTRRSERADLERAIAQLTEQLERSTRDLEAFDARARAVEAQRSQADRALTQAERDLAAAAAAVDRLRADSERLEREHAQTQADRAHADDRACACQAEQEELAQAMQRLSRLCDDQRAQADQARQAAEDAQVRVSEAVEEAAESRARARSAAEAHAAGAREADRLRRRADEADAAVADLEERISAERRQAEEDASQARRAAEQMESARAQAAAVAQRLAEAAAHAARAGEEAAALAQRVVDARARREALERDWNSLEISRREIEVKRESLEDQTADEIELDLDREYGEYRQLLDSGVAPVDADELADEIADLRERISKLGNVNLDAIDEAEALEQRNLDLEQQVADLDDARTRLEELIERLSQVSRERFQETFEAIQQRFAGVEGMFRLLFGGGSAEVRLIPDEDTGEIDWLESGVEVLAKPPGKQPRTISQLSGGEKTMTSVALLLSIFESRPSPFCILDEVDAALDDANVERFVRVADRLIQNSQLIIITHNKRTMHAVDVLYGVTMPERGVSRRVEVRLDEVGEDGKLAGSANARAARSADDAAENEPAGANVSEASAVNVRSHSLEEAVA